MDTPVEEMKNVGGKVPVGLFWQFKETYTRRRESATEALINALRLYIDAVDENDNREGVK